MLEKRGETKLLVGKYKLSLESIVCGKWNGLETVGFFRRRESDLGPGVKVDTIALQTSKSKLSVFGGERSQESLVCEVGMLLEPEVGRPAHLQSGSNRCSVQSVKWITDTQAPQSPRQRNLLPNFRR